MAPAIPACPQQKLHVFFQFYRCADVVLPRFIFCADAEPASVVGTIARRAGIVSGDSN